MFAAGKKADPIDYSGSRTVEDLAKFIAEQGTHKVDAWIEAGEDKDGDVTMADDTMVKAAPAATTSPSSSGSSSGTETEATETPSSEPGMAEKIAEKVGQMAEAIVAEDEAPPEHHDEL